jgi:NMD protein affecting ribosome stability and mRNA decay
MKTKPCEKCGKRFKVLEKGLCYFCFKDKYGVVPTKGCYEEGKAQK